MVPDAKGMGGEMDWGRKWTHRPRRPHGKKWEMGINVDSASMDRPSTSSNGPGDSSGGEKLLPGLVARATQLDDSGWSVDPPKGSLQGEPEVLLRLFHIDRTRQEALEKAGHFSPKWTVL